MLELTHGNTRISWEDVGEGVSGDYDANDPNDVSLLRFYVQRLNEEGKWEDVEDASYCTNVPVDTNIEILNKLLAFMMDKIEDKEQIKRICEDLSWISPEWLEKA